MTARSATIRPPVGCGVWTTVTNRRRKYAMFLSATLASVQAEVRAMDVGEVLSPARRPPHHDPAMFRNSAAASAV